MGHVVTPDGVKADPAKVRALTKMPQPTDESNIRRFLGMANQLGKFVSDLSTVTKPLRDLGTESTANLLLDEELSDQHTGVGSVRSQPANFSVC